MKDKATYNSCTTVGLVELNMGKNESVNTEAAEIIDTAINMGLEVISGRDEWIKNLTNKIVDGEI